MLISPGMPAFAEDAARESVPMWKYRKLVNFVMFQLGWFVCVLSGAHGVQWAAVLVIGAMLAVHFAFLSEDRRVDGMTLAVAGVLGSLADSAVAAAGFIRFASPWPIAWLEPLWMALLWLNFSTTLNASLSWLRGRYVLAALLGAVGGPLAYFGGVKLGAIEIAQNPLLAYGLVALAWAAVMPVLLVVASGKWGCKGGSAEIFPASD